MSPFTSAASCRNAASLYLRWVDGGAYRGFCSSSRRWYASGSAEPLPGVSGLPQQIDLLERYRGLVALGRVTYDEEQVRIIVQVRLPLARSVRVYLIQPEKLRRLQRELGGYAPPALASRYLHNSAPTDRGCNEDTQPWWKPAEVSAPATESERNASSDQGALVRILTHAEEIAALTTPTVSLAVSANGKLLTQD